MKKLMYLFVAGLLSVFAACTCCSSDSCVAEEVATEEVVVEEAVVETITEDTTAVEEVEATEE